MKVYEASFKNVSDMLDCEVVTISQNNKRDNIFIIEIHTRT